MPQTDEERLVVLLEARIRDLEKNMAKASGITAKTYRQMSQGSRSATRQMENDMRRSTTQINQALAATSSQIGIFAKTFAAGLVAGGAAAMVRQVRQVASEVADLAAEADQAGISFEAFQELRYAAERGKVGVDALTDGLKELQLRADEFVQTGKGPTAEAFARLGLNAEDLAKGLERPDQLFETIIGRLGELDRAAQIRIADEIFGGTGGEQFVRLIDEGADGIRRAREEARQLGIVMDEDVGQKAAEVDRKFQILANQVGINLKEAIIVAADALSVFLDRFKEIEARGKSSLEQSMRNLGAERLEIENRILDLKREQEEVTGVLAEAERRNLQGTINTLEDRLDELSAMEARIQESLDKRFPIEPTDRGGGRSFTPIDFGGGGGGRGRTRETAVDAYERMARSIANGTAALVAETEALRGINPLMEDYGFAVEKARIEQELLTAAEEAGRDVTPELRDEIARLAEQYAYATVAANMLAEAHKQGAQRAEEHKAVLNSALSDLRTALADGKLEWEELGDIALSVLDRIIDRIQGDLIDALLSAFQSGGGFGGFGGFGGGGSLWGKLLTTIFGFFFDKGGYTGPGAKHEPAGIVHAGEYVFSKAAVDRLGVDQLESLHRTAKRGYAEGGPVGTVPAVRPAAVAPRSTGSGAPLVSVQVVNNARNTSVREEKHKGPDGREMRKIIIEDVKKEMAEGGFDDSMRRYGARPMTTFR